MGCCPCKEYHNYEIIKKEYIEKEIMSNKIWNVNSYRQKQFIESLSNEISGKQNVHNRNQKENFKLNLEFKSNEQTKSKSNSQYSIFVQEKSERLNSNRSQINLSIDKYIADKKLNESFDIEEKGKKFKNININIKKQNSFLSTSEIISIKDLNTKKLEAANIIKKKCIENIDFIREKKLENTEQFNNNILNKRNISKFESSNLSKYRHLFLGS